VTTDPSVQPLRELAYLPAGEIDPHGVANDRPRAGKLPAEVLETMAPPAKAAAKNEGQSSGDAKESDA